MTAKTKAEKETGRKILVACKFNKPSAILPSGDEGEDAIKMNVVIPDGEIQRDSIAGDFFVGKRLGIEFSLRASDKWEGTLPGVEREEEIIECESDVKMYKRTTKAYSFSFKISCDLIDDNTALRHYANQGGSIRLTLLGDIEAKVKKEKSTAETMAKARPLPGQKDLPGLKVTDLPTSGIVKDGEFISPDEYVVPCKGKKFSVIITVGAPDNGKFYASGISNYLDKNGEAVEDDWGEPKLKDTPYVSLNAAVGAMVGRMIDTAMKNDAADSFLADLRKEAKRLEDPSALPIAMPE